MGRKFLKNTGLPLSLGDARMMDSLLKSFHRIMSEAFLGEGDDIVKETGLENNIFLSGNKFRFQEKFQFPLFDYIPLLPFFLDFFLVS